MLNPRVPALHQGIIELSTKERVTPDRGGNPLGFQSQAVRHGRELASCSGSIKDVWPDCSNGSTQPAHRM